MKTFDWREYYLLAEELLSQADGSPRKEAMLRSAVSRAYYAAFHRACEYLREVNKYPTQQEFTSSRKETHRFLINIFANNPDYPEWRKIGDRLYSLKDFRQKADYARSVEKHVFRKRGRVEELVDRAKEIMDLIDSL
jgi:uncharacterized protein (UPF0332 family)